MFPKNVAVVPEIRFNGFTEVWVGGCCHWFVYGIKYTQGIKQQSYNAELLKKLELLLPSINEQQKIANYFDKFDNLITHHQQRLIKLQNIKKACLEKMFVLSAELATTALKNCQFL